MQLERVGMVNAIEDAPYAKIVLDSIHRGGLDGERFDCRFDGRSTRQVR